MFNLADSSITVGGVLIVLMALLGKDYDGGIARRAKAANENERQGKWPRRGGGASARYVVPARRRHERRGCGPAEAAA